MSTYNIKIIEGRPEDARAVIDFTRKAGSETDNLTFGAEGLEVTPEQEAMFLTEMKENPRAVFLCVWKGSDLIGTGFLSGMNKRMKHRSRLAISVLKSEWNKGVGSTVMEKLIAFAIEIGSEIIELEVRSDNKRAIHLYEKYGFKRIGSLPAFFKIGGDYIDFELMHLDLRHINDSKLTNPIEMALDKADYVAEYDSRRMIHDEVFGKIRDNINVK